MNQKLNAFMYFTFVILSISEITALDREKSGGVAQSVRKQNSNCQGASSTPTLGITRCCVIGKDTKRFYLNQQRCSSVDKNEGWQS